MRKSILITALIFLTILGYSQTRTAQTSSNKTFSQSPKRSIFDFFKTDLRNIPDSSFIQAETSTNSSGQKIQFFRKKLSYKECGIFDIVEVVVISDTSKNVFFKTAEPNKAQIPFLKKLFNDLYLIYGRDTRGNGLFTNKDIQQFNSPDDYVIFGRRWSDYPKYKYPVAIDRTDDELSISIWGVDK